MKKTLIELQKLKEKEIIIKYIMYRDHITGIPTEQRTSMINYYLYFTSGATVPVLEVDSLGGVHKVNEGDLLTNS